MKNKKNIRLLIILSCFFLFPFSSLAIDHLDESVKAVLDKKPSVLPGFVNSNANAESKVNHIAFRILDIILLFSGILSVFFITLSGVRFTFAIGSQDQIDGAKRNLIWSILGLLAVILSWAVITNVIRFVYTKDESPSGQCRAIGCPCTRDEDCDSGNCDEEPIKSPLGFGEACQEKEN